ncbi:MAG: hypothetical protein CML01_11495 [Pseudomonas sp.]|nr:hypothetical protein [Pseudomonas sp.]|tara:strand:- start:48483 stop:49034 length:552 start_codon:yes stop_codon:yes gene_type:complete
MSHEHYFIDVSGYDRVDVYRLIELIGITCPVAQHVFKKAFATGKRGHKDLRRDWQDIADSAARRLQMMDEDIANAKRALCADREFGQQNTLDYRDPRTVAGVDVSFETEKHMSFAPEQKEGAWVEWNGGSIPVLGSVFVDVRMRNGNESIRVEADEWLWGHSETGDDCGDIVAYRLSAEASHA